MCFRDAVVSPGEEKLALSPPHTSKSFVVTHLRQSPKSPSVNRMKRILEAQTHNLHSSM